MTTTDGQATATMINAGELYARILSREPLFILDVRNEDEYTRMHIEGHSNLESINIPYFEFIEDENGMCARIPREREVLVVCAKEGSSQYVAGLLHERGINASYLQGG
ncbi:MAG: MBL fold metallo-hydrolase, partial [Oscillochloris sp.]|nr:MBL fold metallo-hydrolase [Oscillochloris sp.]